MICDLDVEFRLIISLKIGTIVGTSDLEENTLIASLCDLIERIWFHAKCSETSHSNRCAFWVHVSAYCRISTSEDLAEKNQRKQQDENMSPGRTVFQKLFFYI